MAAAEVAGFVEAARAAAGRDGEVLDLVESAARAAAARIGNAMVQGAVNLVAASQPARAACGCGKLAGAHSAREKTIMTMTGPVVVGRRYAYCRFCGSGSAPADRVLGVDGETCSTALRKAVAAAGREVPFARAATLVGEVAGMELVSAKTCDRIVKRAGRAARAMVEDETAQLWADPAAARRVWDNAATAYVMIDGTGAPMVPRETAGRAGKQPDGSSKTVETKIARFMVQSGVGSDGRPALQAGSTSYVAAFESSSDFAGRVAAEALRRDFSHAPRLAVVADGARWIWKIADLLWPGAVQIVDFYHAAEHVHDLAELLKPYLGAGQDPAGFGCRLRDLLAAGRIQALADQARAVKLPNPELEAKAATAVGYFTHNAHRMRYARFRKDNLWIGSGAVEGACKNLVEARAAQSGMRWTIKGLDPVIALRALHRSDDSRHDERYDHIWDRPYPQTARSQTVNQQT
ncbi:MAG: ISKra4 family transposase [Bifidobacteriaceae bacterium]|nr:ISKra4 family transposase [Bifidobacteriaceae bacterium]